MTQYFTDELLPELNQLAFIIASSPSCLRHKVIAEVPYENRLLPIYAFSLGSESPDAPVMNFVGGVHGLERIGSQVIIAYLETLLARLLWDDNLNQLLENLRINFIPMVNPIGMAVCSRANGNHVDLMRNAPVESNEKTAFLVGGHRLSTLLPWYRGDLDGAMEIESQALCDFIEQDTQSSPFALSLDCHSGFGITDRIWLPYAKSRLQPIAHIGEMYHLRELFFQSYPHQDYIFEPQANHYLCHGDLWDYLYDRSLSRATVFLPLTLEMGSWRWIRKNPLQIVKSLGLYHPMKPHRVKRVLRGHLILMDFLTRATASYQHWLVDGKSLDMKQKAVSLWYQKP
ncbi:MAG: M14 family zinc carboxypeptidase [Thalassotalea sp.]